MSKPMTRANYSPEVRERAVRMVLEQAKEHRSQWAAIEAIAPKIGCAGQTLHNWVAQAERDAGVYDSAGLLEEPHRTSLRSELRVYIDARLRYSFQQPRIEQSYRETNLLQSALLRHAEEALAPMRQTSLATSMIGGLSEM